MVSWMYTRSMYAWTYVYVYLYVNVLNMNKVFT